MAQEKYDPLKQYRLNVESARNIQATSNLVSTLGGLGMQVAAEKKEEGRYEAKYEPTPEYLQEWDTLWSELEKDKNPSYQTYISKGMGIPTGRPADRIERDAQIGALINKIKLKQAEVTTADSGGRRSTPAERALETIGQRKRGEKEDDKAMSALETKQLQDIAGLPPEKQVTAQDIVKLRRDIAKAKTEAAKAGAKIPIAEMILPGKQKYQKAFEAAQEEVKILEETYAKLEEISERQAAGETISQEDVGTVDNEVTRIIDEGLRGGDNPQEIADELWEAGYDPKQWRAKFGKIDYSKYTTR